jgi:hypothetical protein
MGGEIKLRYVKRKLGLPVNIIAWRDNLSRCRCTIYVHLLAGTTSSQVDFDISDDISTFDLYYEWNESFLNADIMSTHFYHCQE